MPNTYAKLVELPVLLSLNVCDDKPVKYPVAFDDKPGSGISNGPLKKMEKMTHKYTTNIIK
ncbi:hypothetical protein BpHYR1_031565 [Brachionus plicatilis]|uniref:Uncharacterized protein n=1 Tax=Brachionus plicatilis TaxID=10195 RepID=A0A3M7P694_BRAPC|nr:hypothetical protein BpHYR1_031565 [Brachionus plicatilis]